jgi:putative ABC transport system permease protein
MSAVDTVSVRPISVNGQTLTRSQVAGPPDDPRDGPARMLDGVTGYSLASGAVPANMRIVSGRALRRADAGTDHVIVRDDLLGAALHVRLGDRITLQESGNSTRRTATVVGFYTRARGRRSFSGFFTPPVYGDRALADSLGGQDTETVVTYGVDPSRLSAVSVALQREVPGALVINVQDLTAIVRTILSDLLNVLVVVTGLSLGAGLTVVGNGVTLTVLERRRELAVLKSIGFTPRHVLGFVLLENALVGILAGAVSVILVAVGLALLSRYALQVSVNFDPVLAAGVVVAAAAMAMIIAYLSSRGPLRIRPVEAMRND